MKNFINLLVTIAVFWVGNEYFHEHLSIADTRTLIFAAVLMFVISYLYSFALIVSGLLIPLGIGCFTTIALILASIVLTPIKLWLLDRYLPGFEIQGFWTYVILTIVLSVFTVKANTYKNNH